MCVRTYGSGHDDTPFAPYIARFICASHVGLCIFSRAFLLCFCCSVTLPTRRCAPESAPDKVRTSVVPPGDISGISGTRRTVSPRRLLGIAGVRWGGADPLANSTACPLVHSCSVNLRLFFLTEWVNSHQPPHNGRRKNRRVAAKRRRLHLAGNPRRQQRSAGSESARPPAPLAGCRWSCLA